MRALVIAQPTKQKQAVPSPAWQLYQGSQQRLVRDGLQAVWARYGFRQVIDLSVLSPWHGPLAPEQVIAPYNYTWKGRPKAEVAKQVAEAAIVERLQEAVQGYDLLLVLLSKVYLAPLRLPEWGPGTAPKRWLFFASGEGLPYLPMGPHVRVVPAGVREARREGVKVLDLKAHLFRHLCLEVAQRGEAALEAAWEVGGDHSLTGGG